MTLKSYTSNSVLTAANQPCAGNGGCAGTCAVIDGLQQCFCPTGFVLNRFDQQTCIGKMIKKSCSIAMRFCTIDKIHSSCSVDYFQ